jgi:hypothetical protein
MADKERPEWLKRWLKNDVIAFALFVWVSIGLLNSIFEQGSKLIENIEPAWPLIGPALMYIGFTALWSTGLASIFIFPIFGWRRVKSALTGGPDLPYLRSALLAFAVFEFVMTLNDSRHAPPFGPTERAVFQIVGGIVLFFACFKLFSALRTRGIVE